MHVLGIDGGGTKTHAAIVDENGRLCGTGIAVPSNYDDVGKTIAQANISSAVETARRQAGLAEHQFDAVFMGMAGVVSPTDRAVIHEIAIALDLANIDRLGVDHDCRIALAGALSKRPGIVQIAGTGSATYGRNAAGEYWRSGGWGGLLGDEGSSYWLGLQAMKAAVRNYDGRSNQTALIEPLMSHLQLAHMNDIIHRVHQSGLSKLNIAALAPLVIDAAHAGDKIANQILDRGIQHLASCVEAVASHLGFVDTALELAVVGGLFNAGDIVLDALKAAVQAKLPQCTLT
jgi:N-acetylglucosamine kinase